MVWPSNLKHGQFHPVINPVYTTSVWPWTTILTPSTGGRECTFFLIYTAPGSDSGASITADLEYRNWEEPGHPQGGEQLLQDLSPEEVSLKGNRKVFDRKHFCWRVPYILNGKCQDWSIIFIAMIITFAGTSKSSHMDFTAEQFFPAFQFLCQALISNYRSRWNPFYDPKVLREPSHPGQQVLWETFSVSHIWMKVETKFWLWNIWCSKLSACSL